MTYRFAAIAALCAFLPTTAWAYETWEDLDDAPRMKSSDPTSSSSSSGRVNRDGPALIYSAAPNGKGRGTVSLGARTAFLPSLMPLPATGGLPGARFEINVIYGLHEIFDLEARIGSVVSQTDAEIGVRAHLGGNLALAFSAHYDLMLLNYWTTGDRGEVAFWFGSNQGLTLSGGNRSYQLSLTFDVPLYFAAVSSKGAGSGIQYALRPGVAVEVPIARVVTFSAQLGALLSPQTETYLPTMALAMAW